MRLSVEDIARLAEAALLAHGARPDSAAALARAIAAAERDGLSSHGLAYLPIYCEHLDCGKVIGDAQPVLAQTAPGALVVDAGCGFAHPAIDVGLEPLCALARSQGIAILAIRNSYNCGVLGYHTERMAERGLVALGFTNAPASIAPPGGVRPVLGTNPVSLAVPGPDGPVFVLDQSASVIAKSEVSKRARAGEPIPLGWALDADGQPTTDAQAGLRGTMVPAGGSKGVGLALLVELMAACLPGATPGIEASPFSGPVGGPPRTGQCFIAIAPDTTSDGRFAERVASVARAFVSQPGTRLPGARRLAARARALRDGIEIDPAVHARMAHLAT